MPGHHYLDNDTRCLSRGVLKLSNLIQEHDVVFLLTDSRESRWLPSFFGRSHKKLTMTVALGFDNFIAMRHGTEKNRLGCYFCHDIIGPSNVCCLRSFRGFLSYSCRCRLFETEHWINNAPYHDLDYL